MATIKLIRVKCKNLSTGEDLWRLGVKSIGNVSAEDFVRHASEHCDVKIGTLRASLAAFVDSAKLFLAMGHGVQLGDLGTLQLSVTSKATKQEKDLTAKNLTGVNVNLRPIGDLAREIKNFKFSVAGAVDEKDDDNTGTIDPGEQQTGGGNTQTGGEQQTPGGNQQQTPTTYTLTLKKHEGTTMQTLSLAAGATITYPANTSGYQWPTSKPATMPAQNTTVQEVVIPQTGSNATLRWVKEDMTVAKEMQVAVGSTIAQSDIPANTDRDHYWGKSLTQINEWLATATAGQTLEIDEYDERF